MEARSYTSRRLNVGGSIVHFKVGLNTLDGRNSGIHACFVARALGKVKDARDEFKATREFEEAN
jgi:hypothetical protein